MSTIIERKCGACKNPVEIDMDNIKDVLFYKTSYYHLSCFCNKANRLSQSTVKKTSDTWKYALDHIVDFEIDAKERLELPANRDSFNEYLLITYNVTTVPDRLWEVTGALGKGIYKKKKCKPVSIKTLHETWKWYQHELNKTNTYNKMNHRGPENDEIRILYDLAIVVRQVTYYLAYKARIDAMQRQTKKETQMNHINYDCMIRTEVKKEGLGDISALLDEF